MNEMANEVSVRPKARILARRRGRAGRGEAGQGKARQGF